MKLKTIKGEGALRAALNAETPGRSRVEIITSDGSIRSVRVGQCHFQVGGYGTTLEVKREVEFDEAKRYRVKATVAGFPPAIDYFEDYSAAVDKQTSYGEGVTVEFDSTQVPVLIDAEGRVVREVGADDPPAVPDTDLPF